MANFTFKTEKATGKYRSFYSDDVYIKFRKKVCGEIIERKTDDQKRIYKIRLQVIKDDKITDDNPNSIWKWITLTKEFDIVDDAKTWLKENKDGIFNKFNLYFDEE